MNDDDDDDCDDNNTRDYSNPVTVIVKRIAKKDKINEFEEWLSGISKEFSKHDGSMGIDIIGYFHNLKFFFFIFILYYSISNIYFIYFIFIFLIIQL